LTLRINPLKTSRDEWLGAAAALGLTATAGEHPQAVRLGEHFPVRQLPGYDEGKFSVQDESAMRVVAAVGVTPGMRVLDLCAAPGGKTTHLAELLGDDGLVLACDPDPERLQTVQTLADRLGLRCVQTQVAAGTDAPAGPFDAVLVDAPCGNTGVLGKRPEVRTRLRFEDLRHLVPLQTGLLGAAVERVRPGGVVVFSTCSIEPEENRGVVRRVMAARSDLVLEADEESSPGRPADGGYWARLRRTGSGIDRDGTFAMR
jgi:16S rRNA (cytosine967-C5)-methyltransferase